MQKIYSGIFLQRRSSWTLGNSNSTWHRDIIRMSVVLNNFINSLLVTKSSEFSWFFCKGRVSKPYVRIGIHLLEIICKMTAPGAARPIRTNLTKYTIGSAIKPSLRLNKINPNITHLGYPWYTVAGFAIKSANCFVATGRGVEQFEYSMTFWN